ncbi:MAG: hypothetical protein A3J66_00350 [Candidatus Magasanikbacteria bacterium RIFCSPHIGHO2_02_FULL_47_14]|uniref:Kazal-like domain-containing protein n=1 Tax=Candidatus Magasanikbacteria bacterium RIFCSPHIGHO2_02_FULL_47_14 TaxID=1798680 RepID=A0A1F6MAD1_9BACT|nr:MAG: hypothetical protein A3J66_00350 [Candidatus Magasanikbacteria bacterium RIFCSPHIGHO2_02_FULL_47_14]
MKRTIFLTITSVVLLAGVGCASKTETSDTATSTVAASSPAQRAHALCLSTGNRPELRRVTDRLTPTLVCIFPDGTECPALGLLNDTCVPTAPTAEPSAEEGGPISDLPRFCEPVAEPVCGSDGRTYVNKCVAEQQRITVVKEGSCPSSDVATDLPVNTSLGTSQPVPPSVTNPSSITSPTPQPIPSGQIPKWLEVPIALLEENANAVRPFIQECSIGGQRYYFQAEDCEQCLSVLYTADGQVACYPSHDITNQCPTQVVNRSCKTIWEK